ncbi:guanine nucleotide-binding protein-like 3 homolog [Atheta coriaria]|uniref:guanine nucleotide-binding protein-like 3 homolog n=1 Tax=Dalotia coriaria TaxID=877792 RepID=UPI0031F42346
MVKIAKRSSNRTPAKLRYKIEKKVREANRKKRREAKKNPKSKKQKTFEVPNICPFKEDILKEVEQLKKQKEAERQKLRDQAKLERQQKKEADKTTTLEGLVTNAQTRGKIHDTLTPTTKQTSELNKSQENSLKAYYKEFRKVVEAADVVLEVVDARDPQGTRCLQVEEAVREAPGSKRLVIVVNKADLVPRENLDAWLKYLRKTTPAVAFKASTQTQSRKLGHKKMALTKNSKAMQNSACVGAEMLMSVLANYCRNKGIKTSIRVGIVGLPNVGKSSLINSLKRSRACNVGATPGVTKQMQEVQLDSKIKLLDSPGIVFASGDDSSSSLRNAVKVTSLSDPVKPANAILQRVTKQQMMEMYDITEYSTPDEFYAKKAARMGRFKRGGVPDSMAAARGLLEDWNNGKIKYYTVPPEDDPSVHISSTIVKEVAAEFDVEQFETMETDVMKQLEKENVGGNANTMLLESLGPVTLEEQMDDDKTTDNLISENVSVKTTKKVKKVVKQARLKKVDPEMELEGNLKLNQAKKAQFKKAKKEKNRKERVDLQLSAGLDNFTLNTKDEEYDFEQDFQM